MQNKYYDSSRPPGFNYNPKRNPLRIILISAAWILGIIVFLILCGWAAITTYLTPERIARIISEKSPEFVDGEISVKGIDYSFIHSFPELHIEVDSLSVISHSLKNVSAHDSALLPLNADSLAFIGKISADINLKELLDKEFEISDAHISDIKLNLVMVNDSVSNFNILPKHLKKVKMPEIEMGKIRIDMPLDISFCSPEDSLKSHIRIDSFNVEPMKGKNNFHLDLAARIDGSYHDISVTTPVPVNFSSDIAFSIKKMSASVSDLILSLPFLSLNLNTDIAKVKDGVNISKFNSRINTEDLFSLISGLPDALKKEIPVHEGIEGFLPLEIVLNLDSPVTIPSEVNSFESIDLPSASFSMNVIDGRLSYDPPKGKKVVADDIFLNCEGNYDKNSPEESFIKISQLRMDGEGIYLDLNAVCNEILSENPSIEMNLAFTSNLMRSLSYLLPESGLLLSGHLDGRLRFSGSPQDYGRKGLKDIALAGTLRSNSLDVASKSLPQVNLKGLDSDFSFHLPVYPASSYSGGEAKLDLSLGKLSSSVSKESQINIDGLDLDIDVSNKDVRQENPVALINLSLNSVTGNKGAATFEASEIKTDLSGRLNSSQTQYPTFSLPADKADSIIASRISHSPLYLNAGGEGGMLSTIMTMADLNAEISIGSGTFSTPEYSVPVNLSSVDFSTDLNKLDIANAGLKIDDTSLTIGGFIDGIKGMFTSYSPTLLKADLSLDFNNVDINCLAGAYYGPLVKEKGDSAAFYVPPVRPFTAADSMCKVIPRNIDAIIRLKANTAEYMGYHFSPLSTNIIVKEGTASLDKLTIGAPYCNLVVDWTYSTASLDNIFMKLDAEIQNFSFKPFFRIFPQLIGKAPEINNLSALINASVGCKFLMFPSMFMDFPSTKATFSVRGSDMLFERKGKIEKLTHLMLIDGEEPIKIENLDITGAFHDNLLQLNPFKIRFDDYQIGIAGVNNMKGEMYYHIALEKSPFHVPFGVNLVGRFSHPEIRMGGTGINDKWEREISSELEDTVDINIMSSLQQGWKMFIGEAAKFYLKSTTVLSDESADE